MPYNNNAELKPFKLKKKKNRNLNLSSSENWYRNLQCRGKFCTKVKIIFDSYYCYRRSLSLILIYLSLTNILQKILNGEKCIHVYINMYMLCTYIVCTYTYAQNNRYTLFWNIKKTLTVKMPPKTQRELFSVVVPSDYSFKTKNLTSTCIYLNIKSEIPVNP